MKKFYEHYKRSLVKAISFRLLIMLTDFFIIIAITKSYDVAIGILLFFSLTNTILYFLHERLWNNVHWGKEHKINNR